MTETNKEKLINFLKLKGDSQPERVSCFDKIDKKRVDIPFYYDKTKNLLFITDDEGEIYTLDELELEQDL